MNGKYRKANIEDVSRRPLTTLDIEHISNDSWGRNTKLLYTDKSLLDL